MDWAFAIEKNREALRRVLAMLAAMAGLVAWDDMFAQPAAPSTDGSVTLLLPRGLHRTLLKLMLPAEAAVRRLVIAAARSVAIVLPKCPAVSRALVRLKKANHRPVPSRLTLSLVDALPAWPLRPRPFCLRRGVPRISVPGFGEPFAIPRRSPENLVDAARFALRLDALRRVLDDLPGQAQRFARWRARHMPGPGPATPPDGRARVLRNWPLRPGRPPGWRRKATHAVHAVLEDVHAFAVWALEPPDTS